MTPIHHLNRRIRLTVCLLPLISGLGQPGIAQTDGDETSERSQIRTIEVRGLGSEPIVVRNVIRHGGFLGVSLNNLTPELRLHFGVPEDRGLLVASVVEGSGAESAGIEVGDVLTAVDATPVDSVRRAIREIADSEEGENILVEVYRDGQILEFEATLGGRDQEHVDVTPLVHAWEETGPWEGAHGEWPAFPMVGPDGLLEIDEAHLHEAMESLHERMQGPEWQERVEEIQSRRSEMLERMEKLEERLKELEEEMETLPDGS